jgi:hypothetical protein
MFALKQEGQGLGKQEQGISMALQVEKTSKRGGRIISEKEIMPPPPLTASGPNSPGSTSQQQSAATQPKPEPTITEIMRSPSKVVLLRVSYNIRDLFLWSLTLWKPLEASETPETILVVFILIFTVRKGWNFPFIPSSNES